MNLIKKSPRENLFDYFYGMKDGERRQYWILAELRKIWDNLLGRRLYPYLSDLFRFRQSMRHVMKNSSRDPEVEIPDGIGAISSRRRERIWRIVRSFSDPQRKELFGLMGHLLGEVEKVVNDGVRIRTQIAKDLSVRRVGDFPLNPENLSRGYVLGYDKTAPQAFCVYAYRILKGLKRGFDLEIEPVREINLDKKPLFRNPNSFRKKVAKKYPRLSDFPAYTIESNSSDPLPYKQTVFPLGELLLRQKLESLL